MLFLYKKSMVLHINLEENAYISQFMFLNPDEVGDPKVIRSSILFFVCVERMRNQLLLILRMKTYTIGLAHVIKTIFHSFFRLVKHIEKFLQLRIFDEMTILTLELSLDFVVFKTLILICHWITKIPKTTLLLTLLHILEIVQHLTKLSIAIILLNFPYVLHVLMGLLREITWLKNR